MDMFSQICFHYTSLYIFCKYFNSCFFSLCYFKKDKKDKNSALKIRINNFFEYNFVIKYYYKMLLYCIENVCSIVINGLIISKYCYFTTISIKIMNINPYICINNILLKISVERKETIYKKQEQLNL